ncbi:hypothetical protein [Micromonospora phaseoli]|nr:hypothetical protein [Micromonospora phaseoli]
MEIVEVQGASMPERLSEMRRRPLGQIPVDRATDIVRKVMRHRDTTSGAVEVARFGSVA